MLLSWERRGILEWQNWVGWIHPICYLEMLNEAIDKGHRAIGDLSGMIETLTSASPALGMILALCSAHCLLSHPCEGL